MRTPETAIALIKQFEGCNLTAYWDGGVSPEGFGIGKLTIGYGSTRDVCEGMTITQEEAEARLLQDLGEAETRVLNLVNAPLEDDQVGALVSFVFNIGAGNFERSTLLSKLNALDYTGAADEFERWDKVCGRPNEWQLRRRRAERALFSGLDARKIPA